MADHFSWHIRSRADLNINAEPVTKEEIGNVITAIKSLKNIEKRMDMITIAVFNGDSLCQILRMYGIS